MKQPELGRKIAELRKAKGLTQEELVEKCNINVRTLQRIEAGSVMPRSYTIKVIFAALDHEFFDSKRKTIHNIEELKTQILNGLARIALIVFNIFNLKRNTMKKTTILATSILIIILGSCMFSYISDKRETKKVERLVELQNKNSINWFNSGDIDLLIQDYAPNACFYRNNHPSYCGKQEIRQCLKVASTSKIFEMIDIDLISLNIADTIAVEKSITTARIKTGEIMKTINIQEWHNIKGHWLIVNDIDVAMKD